MLYVAGPMTGLPDFNYPAFEHARDILEAAGYGVLSPTDNGFGAPVGSHSWQWYMREAIKQVVAADAIAVLPDAACSRGALLECTIARALDMEIASVDQWVRRASTRTAEVGAP
jgi:hypothetical protein